MKFVEFADITGAAVMVNPAGVLFLRPDDADRTALHLVGRAEPLVVASPLDEAVQLLESAIPEPPEPTLALLS